MYIHIITLFPEMFESLHFGIVGRALHQHLLQLHFWNPRSFTTDKHQTVDDRPYGGGPGMVMKVEPLRKAIQAAKNKHPEAKVIYLSPQGKLLKQTHVVDLSQQKTLILIAGRYEGIDQRLIDRDIDEVWSIGDYVLSGGELPIMVLIDAMVRLHPQALNDPESAHQDSFSHGLLEHPHYTRPACLDGQNVPDTLLNGDHQAITRWRYQESLKNTWQMRPDLLKIAVLNDEQEKLLAEMTQQQKNWDDRYAK
jgi:tRNA (guanine37-N1)-methyltransferase